MATVFLAGLEEPVGATTWNEESSFARSTTDVKTGTAQSNAQSKFATTSLNTTSSSGGLFWGTDMAPLAFGTSDFTIELWVLGGFQSNKFLMGYGDARPNLSGPSNVPFGWFLQIRTNRLRFEYSNNTVSLNQNVTSSTDNVLFSQTWVFIAVQRQGTNFDMWINGNSRFTSTTFPAAFTNPGPTPSFPTNLTISTRSLSGNSNNAYSGFINQVRISDNALYTPGAASIAVPTTPFTGGGPAPGPAKKKPIVMIHTMKHRHSKGGVLLPEAA
jgi:hypothetical protein